MLNQAIRVFAVGIPKGQPRPKAFARGGRAGVYDPGTANDWKGAVIRAFEPFHGMSFDQPVVVEISLYLPRPKAHFNSKGLVKPTAPEFHTSKPDLDNAAKAILDAMTDCQVWKDDACCIKLVVSKEWTDGKPGADILIQP